MLTFSLEGGKIAKQIEFDLPAATVDRSIGVAREARNVARSEHRHDQARHQRHGHDVHDRWRTVRVRRGRRTITASAGRHKIALAKEGYRTATVLVAVQQGGAQEMDVALQARRRRARVDEVVGRADRQGARHRRPPRRSGVAEGVARDQFTQHYPDEAPRRPSAPSYACSTTTTRSTSAFAAYDSQPDKIVVSAHPPRSRHRVRQGPGRHQLQERSRDRVSLPGQRGERPGRRHSAVATVASTQRSSPVSSEYRPISI